MGVININLNADTGRPLIICIAGSDTQRPQVHFNLNGHTFKGVVYAPYCNKGEGVLVNADNSTFMGTIVGTSISLRGNRSHYVYKDYIDLIKEEVSLKKQASEELYLAMQYYSNNDSYSGNSYAYSANSLMNQAVILQGERNKLVEENSELFKKAGII